MHKDRSAVCESRGNHSDPALLPRDLLECQGWQAGRSGEPVMLPLARVIKLEDPTQGVSAIVKKSTSAAKAVIDLHGDRQVHLLLHAARQLERIVQHGSPTHVGADVALRRVESRYCVLRHGIITPWQIQ